MSELPISVIIPCYHDEPALALLLGQLRALSDTEHLQIVVVDAAASTGCHALCQQHGAQWITASPCRGEQLRLGAAQATQPLLWFVHADAQLTGNPLKQIRLAVHAGALGGYFAFRFSGPDCWQSRWLERLTRWRTGFGIPYGDQGLFATARAYQHAGQHSPWPLFEEVELVKALRRQGRFVCLDQGLLVDPRRWQRDGWCRRSLRNRLLAVAFMLGVPAVTLARWYNRSKT